MNLETKDMLAAYIEKQGKLNEYITKTLLSIKDEINELHQKIDSMKKE